MKYMGIFLLTLFLATAAHAEPSKKRIFVVSSYDNSYLWSKSTQEGLTEAMLNYGYLDNRQQIEDFNNNDAIESSKAVIQKEWMDTKRKYKPSEIAQATSRIIRAIEEFKPDMVMLGDDNAANYIGNQLLDTGIPVVFWGINGLPLKYGLVDSMDNPGHNITGVWQAGYLKESVELLHALVPEAKTFAIIACNSVSSRPHVKKLRSLARKGELPLRLVDSVVTNSFSEFKSRVLELEKKVDAFFILNHDTFVDEDGKHLDMLDVGKWYLENVQLPEASHEDQFVREGMLLTANDSGFNQSYKAFEMAYDILEQGLNPSRMRTVVPSRGPYMVNRHRAEALGISLADRMDIIEEVIEVSIALGK